MLLIALLLIVPVVLAGPYMNIYGAYEENALDVAVRESTLQKGCGGKDADIAFVIDNSASIWSVDYKKQIAFIKDFVTVFRIGPDKVRIAALTFGDGVYYQYGFGFDRYDDEASVKDAISSIPYLHGQRTKTDEALRYLGTRIFAEAMRNPKRKGVTRIGIVLTDGVSSDRKKTKKEALALKAKTGAIMFAVGVGDKVSQEELEIIATNKDYVFRVNSYDALKSIKNFLGIKICEVPTTLPPTTTPPPKDQPCGVVNPADIVLVYDSSEVGQAGISEIQRGIQSFISTEDMQNPNMHVGLIAGECPEVRSFPLNKYQDKTKVVKLFDRLAYSRLSDLVHELRTDGFHPENGARANARHIGILIVTGKPQDPKEVRRQAAKAKKAGIELFVVGAGKAVNEKFLRSLASKPINKHVILGSDFSNFGLVGREMSSRICEKVDPLKMEILYRVLHKPNYLYNSVDRKDLDT